MPSTIYTKEVPTSFGTLDSDALVDGSPASGFVLRAGAMGAHRLLCKRETVLAECWDVTGTGSEITGPSGVALPFWVECARWPIAKMRRRDRLDVSLGTNITSGENVDFFLATQRQPWTANPDPLSNHMVSLTGSGSFDVSLNEGLLALDGYEDELTLYVRGSLSSTLGVELTNGAPNSGYVNRTAYTRVYPSGATTWNTTGNTWAQRHSLVFLDASGAQVFEAQLITGVGEDATGQYLEIWPGIDAMVGLRLANAAFEIRQLPGWRLSHITAITQERVLT